MAELLTVKDNLDEQGWLGAILVKDSATDQHYIVTTVQTPWSDKPETLVFESDSVGSYASTADTFVAGGYGLDREESLADLSARLDDGVLLTPEEARAQAEREVEEDFARFQDWLAENGLGAFTEAGDASA